MVCSPCRVTLRDYRPQHDPGFDHLLLSVFLAHPLEPVDPVRALALSPVHRQYVYDRIRRGLRRSGHDIRAVGRAGRYRYDPQPRVYTQTPRPTRAKRASQTNTQTTTPTVTPP